ncbi:MAG: hypothetical protein OEY78_01840 [Gammaproteobacteria bacterium]|nr:hypothetical protein [Gammaproteobacteria bacterium]
MSEPSQQEDLLAIINLLAGAAQAGANGIIAQAALNVVLASEAVVRARQMELDQAMQDATMNALNDAQNALFNASNIEGAMEEAKQDILNSNQKLYDPNFKQ